MKHEAKQTVTLGVSPRDLIAILITHAEATGFVFPGVAADATATLEVLSESVRRAELENAPIIQIRLDWKL